MFSPITAESDKANAVSKVELEAAKKVLEFHATSLVKHSSARTDAALHDMRSNLAEHMGTALSQKVDWDAMKTTLDGQIRSVWRVQMQGLMKEVEQRVVDTIKAFHKNDVGDGDDVVLAPSTREIVEAIERIHVASDDVVMVKGRVEGLSEFVETSHSQLRSDVDALEESLTRHVDDSVGDVRAELQREMARVPSIVKDAADAQRTDEIAAAVKKLQDHIEGVLGAIRTRQAELEKKVRQAGGDIETIGKAHHELSTRCEKRLADLELSNDANSDLRSVIDALQIRSRKMEDELKKLHGHTDSKADADRANAGAIAVLEKRLTNAESELAKSSKSGRDRHRELDIKLGEMKRESSKATKEVHGWCKSALADTEVKLERTITDTEAKLSKQATLQNRGAPKALLSTFGGVGAAKLSEVVSRIKAHDEQLASLCCKVAERDHHAQTSQSASQDTADSTTAVVSAVASVNELCSPESNEHEESDRPSLASQSQTAAVARPPFEPPPPTEASHCQLALTVDEMSDEIHQWHTNEAKLWDAVSRLAADSDATRHSVRAVHEAAARTEHALNGSLQNVAGLRTELFELAQSLITFGGEVRKEVQDSARSYSETLHKTVEEAQKHMQQKVEETQQHMEQRLNRAISDAELSVTSPASPTPPVEAETSAPPIESTPVAQEDGQGAHLLDARCERLQKALEALEKSQESTSASVSAVRDEHADAHAALSKRLDRIRRDADAQFAALSKDVEARASKESVCKVLERCETSHLALERGVAEVRLATNNSSVSVEAQATEVAKLGRKVDAAEAKITNFAASNEALCYEVNRAQSLARLSSIGGSGDADAHLFGLDPGHADASPVRRCRPEPRRRRPQHTTAPLSASSSAPALPALPRPAVQ
jgi:chromosome segregation ATPase